MPIFKKATAKKAEEELLHKRWRAIASKPGSGGWQVGITNDCIIDLIEKGYSDEEISEIADRAISKGAQFVDEAALAQCTPEQRERTFQHAKQFKIPIYQLAEFNRQFVTDDESLRMKILGEAEKAQEHPVRVVEEAMRLMERRKQEREEKALKGV